MQQTYCFHHFFSENVTKRKNHDTFLPIYSSKTAEQPHPYPLVCLQEKRNEITCVCHNKNIILCTIYQYVHHYVKVD